MLALKMAGEPLTKEWWQPLGATWGKKTGFPLELPDRNTDCDFSPVRLFSDFDL